MLTVVLIFIFYIISYIDADMNFDAPSRSAFLHHDLQSGSASCLALDFCPFHPDNLTLPFEDGPACPLCRRDLHPLQNFFHPLWAAAVTKLDAVSRPISSQPRSRSGKLLRQNRHSQPKPESLRYHLPRDCKFIFGRGISFCGSAANKAEFPRGTFCSKLSRQNLPSPGLAFAQLQKQLCLVKIQASPQLFGCCSKHSAPHRRMHSAQALHFHSYRSLFRMGGDGPASAAHRLSGQE